MTYHGKQYCMTNPHDFIEVYGDTAFSGVNIRIKDSRIQGEAMVDLTPEAADQLARQLHEAAAVARGPRR